MVVDLPLRLRAEVDPRHDIVVVFGRISGGRADNAIPTVVEIGGTVRVPDLEVWRTLPKLVDEVISDIARPFGATVELDHRRGAPPVVNDAAVIGRVRHAIETQLGPDAAEDTPQSMGSEDFSIYLEHIPGAMIRRGSGRSGREADLHSATFDSDDGARETGILIAAASLIELMRD